jgi:CRISPR-associated endonuclease/helicase Cas3
MTDARDFYKCYLEIGEPYAHQEQAFEFLWNNPGTALSLFSPTGSGKTEAVVAPYLSQFLERDFRIAARLLYVLPTQALCNKAGERISGYAKRVNPKIVVGIHHGSHPADPFFMADITVTTLDQLVYAYARASSHVGRHLDFPSGAIASSILAFDEVNMYQSPYTFSIIRAFFEILHSARIPFIVMTATMPDSLLADFSRSVPDLMKNKIVSTIQPFKRKLSLQLVASGRDDGVLPRKLIEKVSHAESALIVANTVDRAKKAFNAIRKRRSDCVLIHSRFTTKDRVAKEDQLYGMIGKGKSAGIVVSTQVCEAGLDVSGEILITELAPADSLIQRFGRCARFGGNGQVYLLYPKDLSPGQSSEISRWSAPYEVEHLKGTFDFLDRNSEADYTDAELLSQFADQLNYHVSDSEAADSIVDLFDATLYADRRPKNLQVREGKPLFLWIGHKGALPKSGREDFRANLMSLDYGLARKLMRRNTRILGSRPLRIRYDWDDRKLIAEQETDITPFSYYIGSPQEYNSEEGLKEQ